MGDPYSCLGDGFLNPGGAAVDGLDVVVDVVSLSAPVELPAERLENDAVVVFQNIGLDGVAVLGGFFDDAHIPDAAHGHVEGPGDRGRRQGQHIHPRQHFLEPLLMGNAEALLLVDDGKAQVLEVDVL